MRIKTYKYKLLKCQEKNSWVNRSIEWGVQQIATWLFIGVPDKLVATFKKIISKHILRPELSHISEFVLH